MKFALPRRILAKQQEKQVCRQDLYLQTMNNTPLRININS